MTDPSAEVTRTMSFSIRAFQSRDEAAVIALWHAVGITRPWNDPRRDIARKLRVQPELFLVGEMQAEVVASVMGGYEGHRAWVYYLAVAPEHQRRGYASALMAHLETLLRQLGCPKLNLMVRLDNAAAVSFYERLGYSRDQAVPLGKRLISDLPDAQ
jgi:ribosomal protein S18 acetylase RimI-like enzyme